MFFVGLRMIGRFGFIYVCCVIRRFCVGGFVEVVWVVGVVYFYRNFVRRLFSGRVFLCDCFRAKFVYLSLMFFFVCCFFIRIFWWLRYRRFEIRELLVLFKLIFMFVTGRGREVSISILFICLLMVTFFF